MTPPRPTRSDGIRGDRLPRVVRNYPKSLRATEDRDLENPNAIRRRGDDRIPAELPDIPEESRALIHTEDDHVPHLIGRVYRYQVDKGQNYATIVVSTAGYRRYLASALTAIGEPDASGIAKAYTCAICNAVFRG